MAGLEIGIGGDASGFEREINTVESQLRTLERRREARVRIGADVGDLDRRITQTNSNLTRLRTSLNSTASASQNLTRQTANGSNTLTQFSRIAQDAPFGIMGIGNNLTATAEAFGQLTVSSGGAGNALRAVGQSLTGVGGILLAVSLVTTALTFMSQQGLTVGDVFNKITGRFDETKKALSDINKEVAKSAGSEIAGLKALTEVAKDNNLSMEKRLLAVKKLQDEYPAYFGNLTKEQILNGNVRTAVDEVSKALIARARATAIAGKLGELAAKRLELEEKREKAVLDIKEKQLKIAKQIASGGGGFVPKVGGGTASIGDEAKVALRTAEQAYRDIRDEIADLDAVSKKYSDREAQATKDSILLLKDKEKAIKATKPKEFQPKNLQPVSVLDPTTDIVPIFGLLTDKVDQFGNKMRELPATISTSMGEIRVAFDTSGQGALLALEKFNEDASALISGSIANTFAGIGEAIGGALSSGGNVIDAVGKTILASIGSMLQDLGKATIAYGVGLIAIKAAIKNPYTAIAAGVAMVAIGSVMSKAVTKSSSTALGGSGGSASTGASYSSPSSTTYGSTSSGGGSGTVVFQISGQSLIGVLSNTLDKNSKLGGALRL